MKLAVKYSLPAADLIHREQIEFDLFRCYPRPALIEAAQKLRPVCIHFPFVVGTGTGDVIRGDTREPADWKTVETLLHQTDTSYLNLHLDPHPNDFPNIPLDTVDPEHSEMLLEQVIRDVEAVTQRLGADLVIIETAGGHQLRPVLEPEFIERVIHETGCGLLLAPSNARLAADRLGMDVCDYIEALPTEHTREIETVGVQRFEGCWVDFARQAQISEDTIQPLLGRLIGHLPMIDEDWDLIAWVMEHVHCGVWREPWAMAFKYGGVAEDHPDELLSDPEVLMEQVPRLRRLIKETAVS
jgi:uncharacterized protein (UPF0276 family)